MKSPSLHEKKTEGRNKGLAAEVKSTGSEFDKFKEDIKGFFQKYDEKLENRLAHFDKKFTSIFEELKKEMNAMRVEVYDAKNELKELKVKVDTMEESVKYHSEVAEEKADAMGDLYHKQKVYLEELEKKLLYQEKHDRRYNLLFYGIPEVKGKNLEVEMKDFFKTKLDIPKESVDSMLFANYHRIPSESKGPRPVIVKFVCMSHRDLVYSKSFHPILRDEKKRILSDLPVAMKRQRGKLAKYAYNIRQAEKKQTRIVEKGLSVYLEVRKDKESDWEKHEVVDDSDESDEHSEEAA